MLAKFTRPLLAGFFLLSKLCSAIPAESQWHKWSTNEGGPDYVLVATAQNVTINCESRYSVVFNGTTPGPLLRMKEGQQSWVRVYNYIPDQNLTVHWHGLSQRADIFSDGSPISQWPIGPQDYFDYAITPLSGDAGSYFYHSHIGLQIITASGPLIVEDASEPPYHWDQDVPILMQDFYPANDSVMEAGIVAPIFQWPGESHAFVFNGQSGNQSFSNASGFSCKPMLISVVPGEVIRIRFISSAAISLVIIGIEDHDNLTIIEADGEYTMPWSTDRLQLGSGQRFSILLPAKTEAELQALGKSCFWLRYETRERPVTTAGYALIQYQVPDSNITADLPATSPVDLPSDIPSLNTWAEYSLSPYNKTVVANFPKLEEVTRTVYITLNQAGPFSNGSFTGTVKWAQNGLPWTEASLSMNDTTPYLVEVYTAGLVPNYTAALFNNGWDPNDREHAFPALVGEVLDIVWLSNSGPSGGYDFHPMHAHGEHFYDLGTGNGTYDASVNEQHFANYTPARRDTTILPKYLLSGSPHTTEGWRAWRTRVTEDNVGAWLMHCHIIFHMAMGMQTSWVFGSAADITERFPASPYVEGYLTYGGDAYGNASYDPFVDGIYSRR